MSSATIDPFAAQAAATRRFALGIPRGWSTTAEGGVLRFLRSRHGRDPVLCLWELDVVSGEERCLVDPRTLADSDDPGSAAEMSRRERARELATGITGYDVSADGSQLVFAFGGSLYRYESGDGVPRCIAGGDGGFDPRIRPEGGDIAFVRDDELWTVGLGDGERRLVAAEPEVRWGVAEFIAAEEMGRGRGHWWSPDSQWLLATRVDERPIATWWLADPAMPGMPPRALRYPAAGGANADVGLAAFHVDSGRRVEVTWDRAELPYLARAGWVVVDGRPRVCATVQSRDQRRLLTMLADPATGQQQIVDEQHRPAPIELVAGMPAMAGTSLVTVIDDAASDTRRLAVARDFATPPGLQVRAVVAVEDDAVWFVASRDPATTEVWQWRDDGSLTRIAGDGEGVASAVRCAPWTVISQATPATPAVAIHASDGRRSVPVRTCDEAPVIDVSVRRMVVTERRLAAAVVLPDDGGTDPLPVLLDPYGGPHAQRVVATARAYTTSQWFADQGYAVVVIDGRGTPGRGLSFERAIDGDFSIVLDDQLAALDALALDEPRLDLARVAIRGWSFGGYLAALAATRAPDRIRAAIVGAPVVDWRWYDTHYTERYLGDPAANAASYNRSNVVGPEPMTCPVGIQPPAMQIIHGFADDNVVVAHALKLSRALLEAGWPHEFLPLTGESHFTTQETVTARLLEAQRDFLARWVPRAT
ncbi:MAG: prolyl oligopeptidase family serine peptidase [Nitriliruptoraceae bacterium]